MRYLAVILFSAAAALGGAAVPDSPVHAPSGAQPQIDRAALDAARDVLAARRTKNLVVLHRGEVAYEWYAADSGPRTRHYTASMAKAIVGGLSLLVAAQDGRIAVDDPAAKYIPGWKEDPRKSRITIRHLATHSSGIEDAESSGIPHDKLPGWKGAFWRRDPDPFSIAIRDAPVVFDPGTSYAYSNPGMAALAYAVTASLRGAPQRDIHALLKERIFDPAGLEQDEWSIGYGRGYDVDGLQLYANWGGGAFSPRAVARIGQVMLQRGSWSGRELLEANWVSRATTYAGTPRQQRAGDNPAPGSGLGWWVNDDGVWASVPRDAFAGAGAGHQVLLVVPSLDLVVVRNGGVLREQGEPEHFWWAIEKFLFDPVIKAVRRGDQAAPYPPSRIIRGVTWAPASQIVRKAEGSDNWPATWAADDNLYTAYGDGWGFEPRVERKLSLGFAKVGGDPANPVGVNIRSKTGERTGEGRNGEKASGMLSVKGTLYMWVRNTRNARLAWSTDRGATWTWSDWAFDVSFGHPAFLNFGKENGGARDGYAYVYSPDHDSAYERADRLVLARVPVERIRERAAYEFLMEVDARGRPTWTPDVARRGAAFDHARQCYRSQVSYHPGLKRYLLCQVLPGADARFEGGFGVYEAPEPWGPWGTVYFTRKWDVGPGESCSFPTKWMDAGGAHLLFSGNDSFSVRRATFRR
jgi:CubicO group peptidase (beta-lactamase class C family)